MKNSSIKNIIFIIYLMFTWIKLSKSSEHRSKRFLTFPRTSPTRYQVITGIGIPVELEIESVTIGWVNKCEFFLPENASNYLNFLSDPFDLTTRPIGLFYRKKRTLEEEPPTEKPNFGEEKWKSGYDSEHNEKYERHQTEAEVVESGTETEDEDGNEHDDLNEMTEADYWNQEDNADWFRKLLPNKPKNLAISRWEIYKSMALFAHSKGLPGRTCVLRSICESAHTSFDHSNGILGELVHILMTPTLTTDEISDHSDYEYFHAEKLGTEGAPCEQVFKECEISILDQFGGIYTPIFDGLNTADNMKT